MTEFQNVSFSYGGKVIFDHFTYRFQAGTVTAVTGPSGSGKTTLLRLLTGAEKPSSGRVIVYGTLAVMYQEPRLLPWFDVEKNLTAILGPDSEKEAEVWLSAVHLEGEERNAPKELSGGMQQRLSLARTLSYAQKTDAGLVILDEPFNGLDPELHRDMRELAFRTLTGKTVILITHDEEDAGSADQILRL